MSRILCRLRHQEVFPFCVNLLQGFLSPICVCPKPLLLLSTFFKPYLDILQRQSHSFQRQCLWGLCYLCQGSCNSCIHSRFSWQPSTCHPVSHPGRHLHRLGVGASSVQEIELLQKEIGNVLGKGGFSIKSWECSGEDRASKYLGMTWDFKKDCYLFKFRLNLFKKFCGIPSGADLMKNSYKICLFLSPREMFSRLPASFMIPHP